MAQIREQLTTPVRWLLAKASRKPSAHLNVSWDTLLHGAIVYLILLFYVVSVYVFLLALWGLNDDTDLLSVPWWLNLLALALVAVTFLPLRNWLWHNASQLIYGQHDDPYKVIVQLNQRLDSHQPLDVIVPTIVSTIASTLKLPYVAIEADHPSPFITKYGECAPSSVLTTIPLEYNETCIGSLHVCPRHPHESLSAADLKLLDDLARQVGITLYAAGLSAEIQISREQLVTAREEERRRIRRDLHDGLGPTLAGFRLQLGALRRLIRQDPEQAEVLVDELGQDVRAATAEIRRLVYNLRPPMLDEFGLVGAIRSLDVTLGGVALTVEACEPMPPLSAAVEVAAYRIVAEAVQNVEKHARAKQCLVQLDCTNNSLLLVVSDDGVGLPSNTTAGVGFISMRERASELGGQLDISSTIGGGTRVSALLPLSIKTSAT